MTESERLYDVLDRLVHSALSTNRIRPQHRYSPLGAALHALHEFRHLATERCICVEEFGDPPA